MGARPKPSSANSKATKIDGQVGAKLRELRHEAGLAMEKLAPSIGVTWQQLFKYEKGQNRIGPGRLFLASKALGVPVADFFPKE